MHNPNSIKPFPPKVKKAPEWLRAFYTNEYLKKNLMKKA